MSLKEIQERHEIIEDQLKVWGGNPEPVDGTESHQDRGELLEMVDKLQAQLELLKGYTHHKVGCKWNSKPVARINEFEVIRQPCSCGLHEALGG